MRRIRLVGAAFLAPAIRHILLARTLLWALLTLTGQASAGETPAWADLSNPMIAIQYEAPVSAQYQATYEYMRERQVLEKLSAFLSPLRLPYRMEMKITECGTTNAFYTHGKGLRLCYEFPEYISRLAPADATERGATRRDVLAGAFIQIVLHEVGHAVFDLFQVPILGGEEDAADQVSAFIMLQFGRDLARQWLTGTAYIWQQMDSPWTDTKFADVHGTHLQRFYNVLCIAYGGQPDNFRDLVEVGDLPTERAAHCAHEYEQASFAFAKTVWPHLDQALVKKVQSIDWLDW